MCTVSAFSNINIFKNTAFNLKVAHKKTVNIPSVRMIKHGYLFLHFKFKISLQYLVC